MLLIVIHRPVKKNNSIDNCFYNLPLKVKDFYYEYLYGLHQRD